MKNLGWFYDWKDFSKTVQTKQIEKKPKTATTELQKLVSNKAKQ